MATTIEQKPLYNKLTVGQDVIFSVSNTPIVTGFTGVKIIAQVFISNTFSPNPSLNTDLVGTFKTTPNNAGIGMFDFRPIIESFVSSDNLARVGSSYKLSTNTADTNVPIHLIDKYSGNKNIIRYLAVKFTTEYVDSDGDIVSDGTTDISDTLQIFNGYLKYTDGLDLIGVNFGYDLSTFKISNQSTTNKFLTNAPNIQYANLEDYGTVAIYATTGNLDFIKLIYKNSAGGTIGQENILRNTANGAYDIFNAFSGMNIIYFGCFPGNLQGSSTGFNTLVTAGTIQGGSIVVQAFNSSAQEISQEYTIDLNCPNTKGFEPIRLCWLNQWGAWDYYTFTMKSSKMISTKGSTYQQLEGSWNDTAYRIDSFRGGKKAFRVNATEKITMNTDFVNENETAWFEELINSPEVYILEGFTDETSSPDTALNKYVIPVRLTTSSYTKKTVANDKIMQYTFEVEKSKTLRTQSV
tara:strand:+ start:502 stop:1899 length:1398 start_codon:yes stop_codon:yes gene_type:complete